MSTTGEGSWADAGLVPPDSSAVQSPARTTAPVPAEDQPRAPKPDLLEESSEADALEQRQELGDDGSEDYPPA